MAEFGSGKSIIRVPAAINPSDGSQTANHDNSSSPTSASLSNTAAGYTTLGGKWQYAAVAAAATDYALFAFQVPAGFRLFITGVHIAPVTVTGVAVVTTTIFDWALGIKSTAVSLATSSLRRIPLGLQGLQALAAVGVVAANDITRKFESPLVVEPGQFAHVILQQPNGANTTNLIFRGDIHIDGYFEAV